MTDKTEQDTAKLVNRKQRILTEDRMTELVNDYIEKGTSLGEGEKINVNDFCNEHNIILPLFYQISAEAGQRTGQIFHYETTDKETKVSTKNLAVVGKRGNIIIKPEIVDGLNIDRNEEDKFVSGVVFDIQCDGNKIILTKKS